jgi:hypothetical protein
MITLSMSETLRSALEQTLATMPNKSEDADIAMSQAAQLVNQRIKQGEPGLYDPSNSADTLVLTLAEMG